MTDTPPDKPNTNVEQKCGLVAIIGAPNAGKSTLVNRLVGQKVAITSPKAQTTRTRLMGIAIRDNVQMLLTDTPGIFRPNRQFDRAMVSAAWDGAHESDIIAFVVDSRAKIDEKVMDIVEALGHRKETRKILLLNKVDETRKDKLLIKAEMLSEQGIFDEIFFISALTGDGIDGLTDWLIDQMPVSPWHFPEDQVSDISERLLAAEVTREQIFRQLHQELPYATAVMPEKYRHRDDGSLEIHQQILVERESQRSIILGKGGSQISAIGSKAREELGRILGIKVHLFLHVKVNPKWDEDKSLYEEIGLGWKG